MALERLTTQEAISIAIKRSIESGEQEKLLRESTVNDMGSIDIVRFASLTGVDESVARWYVEGAFMRGLGLDDAVAYFFDRCDLEPPLQDSSRSGASQTDARVQSAGSTQDTSSPPRKRVRVAKPGVPTETTAPAAGAPQACGVISEAQARAAGDIPDGGETHVEGSGTTPYKVARRGDVYWCTCPAWRNQRLGTYRTCKHIKSIRGEEAERRRLVDAGHTVNLDIVRPGRGGIGNAGDDGSKPAVGNGKKNADIEKHVMLAQEWEEGKIDPTGYLMSEKLDGMRAVWDGAALWSRNGNPIAAPTYFLKALPRNFWLDGELFLGRGRFTDVMSVCRSQVPAEASWREVRYVIFDAPGKDGGIAERLSAASAMIGADAGHVARIHAHTVCRGVAHLYEEFDRLLTFDPPAEGLMLAAPGRPHRGGRCADILKVKKFHTDEAKVVGHKMGKGRHEGRLGALQCVTRAGALFDLGGGFSDIEREGYVSSYPVGTVVEFKYFEMSDHGVPRFPIYVRIRPDVNASEFRKIKWGCE